MKIDRIWTRRDLLMAFGGTAVVVGTIAVAPTAHAENRQPKDAVGYQGSPKDGKRCDGCAHFVDGGSCRLVAGAIAAAGWCQLWTPA